MLSLFGVVRVRHLPTFVSVEPSSVCQLRCPECPVGMRRKESREHRPISSVHSGLMPIEVFERVLEQTQSTAHTMQFYFQGEPLLNKRLPEMIARAHQAGLYTIVSTNAQALDKSMANALVNSGLDRIIVSIDGFSDESYAAYREGGSLQKALEGLQFLCDSKAIHHSSIRVELQVLRLRSNEHEWGWIQRHYKSLGATHLVFKTAQFYDYKDGNPLMPTEERYSRYRKTADGTYRLRRPHLSSSSRVSPCYRLWSGCVITTQGEVLPCCYDKEHGYSFGNIMKDDLRTIFHSQVADDLRCRVLLHPDKLPDMCTNCNH